MNDLMKKQNPDQANPERLQDPKEKYPKPPFEVELQEWPGH